MCSLIFVLGTYLNPCSISYLHDWPIQSCTVRFGYAEKINYGVPCNKIYEIIENERAN